MYRALAVPLGNVVVVMVGGLGTGLIVIDRAFSPVRGIVSVARTVKLDVPSVVGVPVIAPVASFKLKPGGSAPETTLHFGAPVPPVAVRVVLYLDPAVPSGSVVVVIRGGIGAGLILTDKRCSSNKPAVSVARMVRGKVPATVGVPVITPVEAFSSIPGGIRPLVMRHDTAPLPRSAASVAV